MCFRRHKTLSENSKVEFWREQTPLSVMADMYRVVWSEGLGGGPGSPKPVTNLIIHFRLMIQFQVVSKAMRGYLYHFLPAA